MNHLININDLIVSGTEFSIRDSETEFTPDHELSGVTFLSPEPETRDGRYVGDTHDRAARTITVFDDDSLAGGGAIIKTTTEVDDETELSIDNFDLLDGGDRWGHEADAFVAHQENMCHLEDFEVSGDLTWERRSNASLVRERRVANLMRYIWVHRADRRRIAALRAGINKRYVESVRLISSRDRGEWEMLYVTKAQRMALLAACTTPTVARDYLPPTQPAAIEEIPTGGWDHILAMALLTA